MARSKQQSVTTLFSYMESWLIHPQLTRDSCESRNFEFSVFDTPPMEWRCELMLLAAYQCRDARLMVKFLQVIFEKTKLFYFRKKRNYFNI